MKFTQRVIFPIITSLFVSACGPFTKGKIEYVSLRLTEPNPNTITVPAARNKYEVSIIIRAQGASDMQSQAYFFACDDDSNQPDSWHYEDTKITHTTTYTEILDKKNYNNPILIAVLPEGENGGLLNRTVSTSSLSKWPVFKWRPEYKGKAICMRVRSASILHWRWTSALRIDDILAREGLISPD
jgi:hypothetical protein